MPNASDDPPTSILDHAHRTALVAVAAAAWLALATAQAGAFSADVAIAGGAAAGLAVLGLDLRRHRRRGTRPVVTRWDVAALMSIAVLVWRAYPANTPWIAFLDASWYTGTAARIDRDGGLAFRSAALAEVPADVRPALVATYRDERAVGLPFPDDTRRGFHAVIFAAPDTAQPEVVPYHPPLFAASLAVAASHLGPLRTGDGALVWALAWLLGIAAVARAAFGAPAALMATAAAGLGPAFGYYAANPYAEMAAGALALGGIRALVDLATPAGGPAPRAALAAGLGLGLAGLAKVDLAPAVAAGAAWWWLDRRRVGGRREGAAIAFGLSLPALHGLWLATTVSNVYVTLNGGGIVDRWRPAVPWVALAVLIAVVAVWAWRHAAGDRPPTRQTAATVAVVALGLAFGAAWLTPEGAPPAPVAILAWLMTPLAVWAAAAGLVGCLDVGEARHGPLVASALVVLPLLLVDPVVSEGLSPLYTARRLVPLAVPVVAILASGAASAILASGAASANLAAGVAAPGRARTWLVAGGAVLILVAQAQAARSFSGPAARDFAGGPRLAGVIADHAGPHDVVVFASTLDGTVAGRLASAVWTLEGREAVVVGSPDVAGATLAKAVDAWRAAGRNVLWVDDAGAVGRDPAGSMSIPVAAADGPADGPAIPGYTLVEVGSSSIITQAPAPSPQLPPRMAPLPIDIRVRTIEPADP